MIRHLYDEVAKRWYLTESSKIVFYSDPHFGDFDMYLARHTVESRVKDKKTYYKYSDGHWEDESSARQSMEESDEEQIKTINQICGKKDTLVMLGDIGDEKYIPKLKAGYKVLILGNHDKKTNDYYKRKMAPKCPSCSCKSFEIVEDYSGVTCFKCKDCGRVIAVSDFKEGGQHADSTYDNKLFDEVYPGNYQISPKIILSHKPCGDLWAVNIHGHDHSGLTKTEHSLNVCADVINFQPITLNSIVDSGLLNKAVDIHEVDKNITSSKKERINQSKVSKDTPLPNSPLEEETINKAMKEKNVAAKKLVNLKKKFEKKCLVNLNKKLDKIILDVRKKIVKPELTKDGKYIHKYDTTIYDDAWTSERVEYIENYLETRLKNKFKYLTFLVDVHKGTGWSSHNDTKIVIDWDDLSK